METTCFKFKQRTKSHYGSEAQVHAFVQFPKHCSCTTTDCNYLSLNEVRTLGQNGGTEVDISKQV